MGLQSHELEMETLLNREESGVRGKNLFSFDLLSEIVESQNFVTAKGRRSDHLSDSLFYRSVLMWPRDLGFIFIAESGFLEFQENEHFKVSSTRRETLGFHMWTPISL